MPKLASRLGKLELPTRDSFGFGALKIALGLLNSPSMPLSSTTEIKRPGQQASARERQWSQATREGEVV